MGNIWKLNGNKNSYVTTMDHSRLFAMFPDDFPQAENSEKPKDWIGNCHFFRVSPGMFSRKVRAVSL